MTKFTPGRTALISAVLLAVGGAGSLPAAAAPDAPSAAALQPQREIDRLRSGMERHRVEREAERMKEAEHPERASGEATGDRPAGEFSFRLTELLHTESSVLSEAEWTSITASWLGHEVGPQEISDILKAVNDAYRSKGYVVCRAVVKPQRISEGRLLITLIEGKTGKVTVDGNDTTNPEYLFSAVTLPEGEVANYDRMVEELIRFNMTNDVQLRMDVHAGEKPGTTDYDLHATEPDPWNVVVFADTTGTRSTGRVRAGASFTAPSVLGIRDAFSLLGIKSEGSTTGFVSYSLPINASGTRVSVSYSEGDVDVVNGETVSYGVEGDSTRLEGRIDHPFYVTATDKITAYFSYAHQTSETKMFETIVTSDLKIDAYTIGAEGFRLGEKSLVYLNVNFSKHDAENAASEWEGSNYFTNGSLLWRVMPVERLTLSVTGAWQFRLGGDAVVSADQFSVGHSYGVRGYDNDVLAADNGYFVNFEAGWDVAGNGSRLFGFFDGAHLAGNSVYEKSALASFGAGLTWPLWTDASVTVTASRPILRSLGDGYYANNARFDLAFSALW
ncbi:ShlB/FhaC/HecB family hemolysin secretion/activation protein [Sutterella sp.]|uniref:ShlB/FhaC/HecB family hemolysin secretion/activation protein n=1 Tax=Sutterella sp. TaxID=1981025 RepID=UPI0026DEE928|nr:ShlB/FhaC/HecB family hemolysin secretion/activation protein [Sutterella sp.]MDO5532047.1 ShlB/FhaC/HecB family hemolysin secretion/activation protein [Sutterella sp.]